MELRNKKTYRYRFLNLGFVTFILIFAGIGSYLLHQSHAATSGPAYPLKLSPNHRYLVDQNNQPFLIVGDSPQSLIGNLSVTNITSYFNDRAAHGFNTVWLNLLCDDYTYCNADGTTYDGIKPFNTGASPSSYDLSTPNATYFSRVDSMINAAAAAGIDVVLDPIETGGCSGGGWMTTLENNGDGTTSSSSKDYQYGQFLGNRYKNFPNIIWASGNDFQCWQTTTDNNDALAVAEGIKSVDSSHLQTLELQFCGGGGIQCEGYSSLDDTAWSSILGLNASYTYSPTYANDLRAYNQTPTLPMFLVEANYEGETDPQTDGCNDIRNCRMQEWWTMTSGAAGQMYGCACTTHMTNSTPLSSIDTPGITQLGYVTALLQTLPWYNLVPDQSHSLLTAGYGTFQSSGSFVNNDYATAAKIPDGSAAVFYMPTSRTITVNLAQMGGAVTARWYDPTAGIYSSISGSPFANSGSHQFTPPGSHSDGTSDWVLELQANVTNDTTPPSTPTGLVTTSVSGTAVSLSWTASTDNVAVDHYQVLRDGAAIGISNTASYTDNAVAPGGSYSYAVEAFDFAGNSSAASTALSVTAPSTFTIGETNVLPNADSGNGNLLVAQHATLTQAATIQSLSFYVTTAAGKLRLGIYDATGAGGGPGALKAQTVEITPVTGWNTANVTSPMSLSPGTYWLAYLPSNNSLAFVNNQDSSSSGIFCNFTYAALPTSFCSLASSTTSHWSLYATLDASGGSTPVTGDLNNDGHVNIFDLSIFLSHWQQTGSGLPEDFNNDNVVNIFDLSILLSHYGT